MAVCQVCFDTKLEYGTLVLSFKNKYGIQT